VIRHITKNIWWSYHRDSKKSGRFFLYFSKSGSSHISFEWVVWTDLGISFSINNEQATFGLNLGLFGFYISLDHPAVSRFCYKHYKYEEREFRLHIFEKSIWLDLWCADMWRHRPGDKWYKPWTWTPYNRKWSFNPFDFFLGRRKHFERTLYEVRENIPMPEGNYEAKIRFFESTWKRPRWPWPEKLIRADITPKYPIPHPGKGENSWDCDEDASYSMTCPASTTAEAVEKMRDSIMRSRKKYGSGEHYRPEKQYEAQW
jgi:hypothetical protein